MTEGTPELGITARLESVRLRIRRLQQQPDLRDETLAHVNTGLILEPELLVTDQCLDFLQQAIAQLTDLKSGVTTEKIAALEALYDANQEGLAKELKEKYDKKRTGEANYYAWLSNRVNVVTTRVHVAINKIRQQPDVSHDEALTKFIDTLIKELVYFI